MKKFIACITVLLLCTIPTFASLISGYDFTFYKTISQTLSTFNDDNLGLDYTGFGFVGKNETSGIFMRIGFQAPLPNLKKQTASAKNATQDPTTPEDTTIPSNVITTNPSNLNSNATATTTTSTTGTTETNSGEAPKSIHNQKYSFCFIIGPALRLKPKEHLNMYFGFGLRISEDILLSSNPINNVSTNTFTTGIGFDVDIGAKIDLNKKTSFRIGIYSTSSILSFTSTTTTTKENDESEKRNKAVLTVFFDLLNPQRTKPPLVTNAYISMGQMITDSWYNQKYSYIITSDKKFTGTLVPIE